MMRRAALFFAVLAVFLGAGFLYFGSAETLSVPANFSKAWDFLSAAKSVVGLPWWSPMFMGGTSLAGAWSFMVTNAVLWVFGIPLGFLIGPKVAMVAVVALGATGVFLYLSKFTEDKVCALLGGVLFLVCPSLLTRAAGHEQFAAVCSMVLLPWTFLALFGFFRSPSPRTALLAAMAFSAVTLASGKMGVMALPILLLYCASEYFGCPHDARPRLKLILWSALAFVLLAVVPNLPSLRETGFAALFDFSPFPSWQLAFSTKSALGWIDRGGWLTPGMDGAYAPSTGNGGTYLGLLVFTVFVLSLFLGILHNSPEGRKARLFLALALFAFWLSFGPKGVLGGHMQFLALSSGAPDHSPALGWFFLAAQVWVIFQLVPPEWPTRRVLASVLSAIYLVVPGFRILEWLPICRNIRAPFDFFQVTGAVCVVISAAIIARLLLARLRPGVRSAAVVAACALVLWDVVPYARPFFRGNLDAGIYKDFLATQTYLKSSRIPGRVCVFSGRHFYLLTPFLSGRALISEVFNSHMQQRGTSILQGIAFSSDDNLMTYLRIAGVSHVFVDKTDPDTPVELQDRLCRLLPAGFENKNFVVLENNASLGGGFFARDFFQAGEEDQSVASPALSAARYSFAVIQLAGVAADKPGFSGRILQERVAPRAGGTLDVGTPFKPVSELPGGNYQRVIFAPSSSPGWLVMNQAWHPDWRAFEGGKEIPVRRAFLAFSAVDTKGVESVTFRFDPPWWYPVCVVVGLGTWAVCAFLILFAPLLPATFRQAAKPPGRIPPTWKRRPIRNPALVIPTYNEALGIGEILDKVLSQREKLAVLVVDDGSPDGTGDMVREHPAFGKRVHLLERAEKLGLGSAYREGFAWAGERGHDAVLEMDADLSHDPADIPRLLEALDAGADAAVGSRYIGGVRVINWPEHRLMLSVFASKFVRVATGLPLTDATSGFKALRMTALDAIDPSVLRAEGYGFQVELHHALWTSGAGIVEVPIVFTERRDGQTKMSLGIAVEAFLRVLQLSVR